MKRLIGFYFLIFGTLVYGQEMLIPYRVGEKMGLINEADKVVVEPKYDEIDWLSGSYFQFTQKVRVKDSLETEPGKFLQRNHEIPLRGLMHEGKVIIEPQPFMGYHLLPGMMVNAMFGGDAEKLSLNQQQYDNFKNKKPLLFLFNAKGENVNPQGFRRLELVDTAGISIRNSQGAKYALLFMENFQKQFKMCVFDVDEGNIKECLFENVTEFGLVHMDYQNKSYVVRFKDAKGKIYNKVVKTTPDYFFLEEAPESKPEGRPLPELIQENLQKSADLQAASPHTESEGPQYWLENGVVKYKEGNNLEKELELAKDIAPKFKNARNRNLSAGLIYKKGNQYGLIQNGEIIEPKYDSLIYFGNDYYLACKKINTKLKCGTLDLNEYTVIPFEYDSIAPKMKTYEFKKMPASDGFQMVLKAEDPPVQEADSASSYFMKPSANVIVYKDGKSGMRSLNNEEVFSVEYEEIGMNGFKTKGEKNTKYIVLKKNGQFGVVMKNFDSDTKQSVQTIIEPIFPYFPAFYFKDYYGNKGFYLFGLVDENGKLKSYASEIGRVYSE